MRNRYLQALLVAEETADLRQRQPTRAADHHAVWRHAGLRSSRRSRIGHAAGQRCGTGQRRGGHHRASNKFHATGLWIIRCDSPPIGQHGRF